MGVWSWLLRAPAPVAVFVDEALGAMTYSEDEDGWVGRAAGLEYSIARVRAADRSRPSPELLAYARRVLADPAWRAQGLEDARIRALAQHDPSYEGEIRSLAYASMGFYLRKSGPALIADLGEGPRGRSWRIEFEGDRCEGIGFDT